jgi:hypothetical protein
MEIGPILTPKNHLKIFSCETAEINQTWLDLTLDSSLSVIYLKITSPIKKIYGNCLPGKQLETP